MHRFFIERSHIQNGKFHIYGHDARHIGRVIRLRDGDTIELCDLDGTDYIGKISRIDKDVVSGTIVESHPSISEPSCKITLYQGLPKGDKMDTIIQKGVELGIYSIVPIMTERTIVRFKGPSDIDKKTTRWQRIAKEAAKQSKRAIIPYVKDPISFTEGILKQHELMIFFWEEERKLSLNKLLTSTRTIEDIGIFIGPEGGFSMDEAESARKNGWHITTLGPRILRTETVSIAVISAIMFYLEEWQWR